jgi:antirestriction protein ArdC
MSQGRECIHSCLNCAVAIQKGGDDRVFNKIHCDSVKMARKHSQPTTNKMSTLIGKAKHTFRGPGGYERSYSLETITPCNVADYRKRDYDSLKDSELRANCASRVAARSMYICSQILINFVAFVERYCESSARNAVCLPQYYKP